MLVTILAKDWQRLANAFSKNEDGLKNEDDLKNGNNLKNEDDLKNEDNLKNILGRESQFFQTVVSLVF